MIRLRLSVVDAFVLITLLVACVAQASAAAFPAGGRAVTLVVGNTAGGSTDLGARILAAGLERQFGSPFVVVNKPGANGQVGYAEVAQSRPDGYTLAATSSFSMITTYLDAARKATYSRQSFATVANYNTEPFVLAVKGEGPLKTIKDLVDAAKAKPGVIKAGLPGILSGGHIPAVMWSKLAGIQFAEVHFAGAGDAATALLGGHVDFVILGSGALMSHFKSGSVRVLAILDREENEFYPGVKTLRAQGYNVDAVNGYGVAAPAGTPKEIVDALATAIEKAMQTDDVRKRMSDLGRSTRFMGPAAYAAYWLEMETSLKPVVEEITKGR